MKYIIYDTNTGKLQRFVCCPEFMAQKQLNEGESLFCDDDGTITGTLGDTNYRLADGQFIPLPPPPPPTAEEIRAGLIAAAQRHLDAYARTWGYDDMRSAVSYVGDPYPRFNSEGLALRNWRSAVWAWLDAQATQSLPDPLPTSEEFIALLPAPPARP